MDDNRLCSCESGLRKQAQYDARGIFLCYTCEGCHQRKLSSYRLDILTDPNYPAQEPIEED